MIGRRSTSTSELVHSKTVSRTQRKMVTRLEKVPQLSDTLILAEEVEEVVEVDEAEAVATKETVMEATKVIAMEEATKETATTAATRGTVTGETATGETETGETEAVAIKATEMAVVIKETVTTVATRTEPVKTGTEVTTEVVITRTSRAALEMDGTETMGQGTTGTISEEAAVVMAATTATKVMTTAVTEDKTVEIEDKTVETEAKPNPVVAMDRTSLIVETMEPEEATVATFSARVKL